ncbi:hypothetical protein D3C81_1870820 [compost metagenome]
MHTNEYWIIHVNVTFNQSNMLLGVHIIGVRNRTKLTIICWHPYLYLTMDKLLFFIPVMN